MKIPIIHTASTGMRDHYMTTFGNEILTLNELQNFIRLNKINYLNNINI